MSLNRCVRLGRRVHLRLSCGSGLPTRSRLIDLRAALCRPERYLGACSVSPFLGRSTLFAVDEDAVAAWGNVAVAQQVRRLLLAAAQTKRGR